LKYVKETNSILFTGTPATLQKIETILKKFDAPAGGFPTTPTTFIVYTPKHVPGDELIQILSDFEQNLVASGVANKSLFDTISNLKYVPRTCSLIISGDQESIAKVEELLRRFDVPTSEPSKIPASIESIQNTSFLIYKLEYHQGDEILSALKQIASDLGPGTATGNQNLLNAINSLQWIRVTNSLLASGEADTLSKLRDLIVNLDIPLRQVFIEVLLIQTSLSNTQNFGLQWGGKLQFLNRVAAGTGNFPAPSTNAASSSNSINPTNGTSIAPGINANSATATPLASNVPFTNGFDLGVIGDIIMHKGRSFLSLGSLVNALQLDTDSTVVLNPKIITQDNRTSTLFVGTNVPFIGSQVTATTTIISSSANIEYRDVGFNLTITPTIGNSNIVTLDISSDISQVISNPTIGVSGTTSTNGGTVQGIESSHTTMATRVHVPDQHFVVLSGMIQDTKTRYRSAIPCLGGLPVIGAIFSENDRNDTKNNLIIFMRPQIINTYDDYKKVTDDQECLYKDQAVLPVLKEEFDAGIDIVKKPEDE
ncbi:MAG TPA: secretin N-terminal domain-containing protein, partial [Rhabdochlamydiaceae bacterium]|nr:secretin N-terminal domain-containing protein [Rhabdochlamydiaceae bacterium]